MKIQIIQCLFQKVFHQSAGFASIQALNIFLEPGAYGDHKNACFHGPVLKKPEDGFYQSKVKDSEILELFGKAGVHIVEQRSAAHLGENHGKYGCFFMGVNQIEAFCPKHEKGAEKD